jgi:hypothetical protein
MSFGLQKPNSFIVDIQSVTDIFSYGIGLSVVLSVGRIFCRAYDSSVSCSLLYLSDCSVISLVGARSVRRTDMQAFFTLCTV